MTIKQVNATIPNRWSWARRLSITAPADGESLILHTSVSTGYDVPWGTLEALLIETALDDWYVSYEINCFTKEPHRMAMIYSSLHQNILEKFDTADVEIMSPHYYSVRDGNASTVPSVLGAKGYTPPVFNLNK